MKKLIWKICSRTILFLTILSFGLALLIHHSGSNFDPVREVIKLKNENRRTDAQDLVQFCIKNQSGNLDTLTKLEEELEHTLAEKVGSFIEGAAMGKVYDTYSGLGAISSDLCIYGDIRDLGIQACYYFKENPDFDSIVLVLSSIGIILSVKPLLHGIDSLIKNSEKYVKKIHGTANLGIMRQFIRREIPLRESKKVWELLKKTTCRYPAQSPVYLISALQNISIQL